MPHLRPTQPVVIRPTWLLLGLGVLPALVLLGGCQYHLRGVILDGAGNPPTVSVVGGGDPRLQQEGLRFASVSVTVDPDEHTPDYIPEVRVDSHGRFDIPISDTGAGILMYKLEVVANAEGYAGVSETIDMPPSFKRLVITLPPGGRPVQRSGDLLEKTMNDAKLFDR